MAEKTVEYTVHDYDPLNKAIDENLRIKRTRSVWGYAKSAALIMVAVGILALLLAWAYYLYKKPHRLVSLDNIEKRMVEAEKKLPKDDEVGLKTGNNVLKEKIIEKDDEIKRLKQQIQNNPENQALKNEKKALEQEKKRLEKKLSERDQVQTNVIHFESVRTTFAGEDVNIITRLYYDDPRNSKPNKINCYISFVNRPDIKKIELGDIRTSPSITSYHKSSLGITDGDAMNIKRSKCQFDLQ